MYVATSPKGLEEISVVEINELIGAKAEKLADGRVGFEAPDIGRLLEYGRSIDAVYSLMKRFKFSSQDDILKEVEKTEMKVEEPFVARCWHSDENIVTKSIEAEIGAIIHKRGFSVNLEQPKTTVIVDLVGDECFLGTLVRAGMHRREYRVKVHNRSVNACMAYCLVRKSGYSAEKTFLDPFCMDGIVIIEAASYALGLPREKITENAASKKINVTGVDSLLHNIRSCEINAKLAEVKKNIKLSKYDLDWLDLKVGQESVDCIATIMPYSNWEFHWKELIKTYAEFFKQCLSILKKGGKVAVLALKPDAVKEAAEGLKLAEEREVWGGKQSYSLMVFSC